jgi:hypothetical protein
MGGCAIGVGVANAIESAVTGGGTPLSVAAGAGARVARDLAASGPVVIRSFAGATDDEIAAFKAYVAGAEEARLAGALSPTGRIGTSGTLRVQATAAGNAYRFEMLAAGRPVVGHPGHVPDTTWTGNPIPYSWLDLPPRVNMSIGAQALPYPIGYYPTRFILEVSP